MRTVCTGPFLLGPGYEASKHPAPIPRVSTHAGQKCELCLHIQDTMVLTMHEVITNRKQCKIHFCMVNKTRRANMHHT